MSNDTTDEFSYETTPSTSGATTFQDPAQGGGSDGGDDYGAADGVAAEIKTPTAQKTKCVGFCAAPRLIDKRPEGGPLYVSVKFTCVEPPELAGRTDDLFGPVEGGDSAGRQRYIEALAAFARKVGATWNSSSLKTTLQDMKARFADAGATVQYTLSVGKKGGVFINP